MTLICVWVPGPSASVASLGEPRRDIRDRDGGLLTSANGAARRNAGREQHGQHEHSPENPARRSRLHHRHSLWALPSPLRNRKRAPLSAMSSGDSGVLHHPPPPTSHKDLDVLRLGTSESAIYSSSYSLAQPRPDVNLVATYHIGVVNGSARLSLCLGVTLVGRPRGVGGSRHNENETSSSCRTVCPQW